MCRFPLCGSFSPGPGPSFPNRSTRRDCPPASAAYKYRFWVKDKRLPASKVRAFDPHAGIPDEYRRQVLGAECCAWSETLHDRAELEYKTLHRLPAFAAALCEGPLPKK